MSRLFPEALRVGLAPAEVTVGKRRVACDAAYGPEPWQGALAALGDVKVEGRCRVTVVLSNHFVRYALVPRSDALSGPAEEQGYLRHHFARVHGERAKGWVFRWSEGLASAVDARLLSEMTRTFSQKQARLVSVQPALMAAVNRWREAIPAAGAWLVLVDPERACVALHAAGRWRSVQNARGGWLELLERERHRAAGEVPELVLLAGAAAPRGDSLPGCKFRELAA